MAAYKRISPQPVVEGGTGKQSNTAYAVLCGGTTSTGAIQSIAGVGSSGQVLTSNGSSSLPTFQTISSSSPFMIGVGPVTSSTSSSIFINPFSTNSGSSSVTSNQIIVPFNITVDLLTVWVQTKNSTTNDTVLLNVQESDTALSITATSTGDFQDTTHSINITNEQFMTFKLSQSTTGTNTYFITCRVTPT